MSHEMRILLNTLVNAAKAQRRALGLQIEDYETLLREGTEDTKDAIEQSDFENSSGDVEPLGNVFQTKGD